MTAATKVWGDDAAAWGAACAPNLRRSGRSGRCFERFRRANAKLLPAGALNPAPERSTAEQPNGQQEQNGIDRGVQDFGQNAVAQSDMKPRQQPAADERAHDP